MNIKPNDLVLHKPSGEEWIVCGVNYDQGKLIPCGYPFPSRADISDCELIESRYNNYPQSEEQIKALKQYGCTSFIDVKSAMYHGLI